MNEVNFGKQVIILSDVTLAHIVTFTLEFLKSLQINLKERFIGSRVPYEPTGWFWPGSIPALNISISI